MQILFFFFCYQFSPIPVRFCKQESFSNTDNLQYNEAIASLGSPASELFGVLPKNAYFWAPCHAYHTRISGNGP